MPPSYLSKLVDAKLGLSSFFQFCLRVVLKSASPLFSLFPSLPYCHPQTCHALARSSSSASDETDSRVNAALFNLAGDKLKEHYTRANPALFPFVEATLSRQAADVC